MITLTIVFCLITTGECASLTSTKPFESLDDCDKTATSFLANINDEMAKVGITAQNWTCHNDPEDPKG